MTAKKKLELIPPDVHQCQADKPNGHTFMTLGGVPGMVRCTTKPIVIVTQRKGRLKGSMSLCVPCWNEMILQLGEDYASAKPIMKAPIKGGGKHESN